MTERITGEIKQGVTQGRVYADRVVKGVIEVVGSTGNSVWGETRWMHNDKGRVGLYVVKPGIRHLLK